MKKCSKCKLDKPKSEFCKDVGKKDGLCSHCKSCTYKRGKNIVKLLQTRNIEENII